MGFWGSLFGGSNPTLNAGIKQAGDVSQFTTGLGKNLTGQAGDWMSGLLSGDPAKTAKLLSPQIKGMQDQAQQQKRTMAQFGNRSGGTNAKGQTIDDTTRSNVNDMIAKVTSGALSESANMGQGLLQTGMNALNQQVQFSADQMQNWSNSILGLGVTKAIGGAEGAAMAGMAA